jgi:predicted DsbA family dithiol-disulfide isomerase
MKFMFFKNPKFPTALFITASLIVFLVATSFYFVFKLNFFVNRIEAEDRVVERQKEDKYFYKDKTSQDPYITLKPSLKNLINGPIISEDDPILGNLDAKVSMVIFSDFSCNFCANQEASLKKVLDKYGNQINLIWKDYPLNNLESESFRAARSARCAKEQNKFWPCHDLLFENPDKRSDNNFIAFALELGLNQNKFENCLEKKEVDQKIENNILEANALDIYGIPFIYINDQEVVGEINEEELGKIIERELSINN